MLTHKNKTNKQTKAFLKAKKQNKHQKQKTTKNAYPITIKNTKTYPKETQTNILNKTNPTPRHIETQTKQPNTHQINTLKNNLQRARPTGLAHKQNKQKHIQLKNLNTWKTQYINLPRRKPTIIRIKNTLIHIKPPLHTKAYTTYPSSPHTHTPKPLQKTTQTTQTQKPQT
jgi:hypothetical protein